MARRDKGVKFLDLSTLSHEHMREDIARRIEECIAANTLASGDRLPSERELAQFLGVGRPSVREAIRLLEERGLVEMKPRSGIFVKTVEVDDVADSIERYLTYAAVPLEDFLTLRETMEPKVASLAAERATPNDLVNLKGCIEAIEDAFVMQDVAALSDADYDFHNALAAASHNNLFIAINGGVQRIERAYIESLTRLPLGRDGVYSHRLVYDALTANDPIRAHAAMVVHMSTARKGLLNYLATTTKDLSSAALQEIPARLNETNGHGA